MTGCHAVIEGRIRGSTREGMRESTSIKGKLAVGSLQSHIPQSIARSEGEVELTE
jgi:hypothetical protein